MGNKVERLAYKNGKECIFYLSQGNRHGLITGGTGSGKCLGGDVLVRMFDGSAKKAKDVKVGDKLMGMDSTPRTVLKTNKGFGDMYKVIPNKGEPWICNDVHILSLQCSYSKGTKYKQGDIVDIPLDEYLKSSDKFKHAYKQFRVGVDYTNSETELDPYFVGLFLGDGSKLYNKIHISVKDTKVVNWLRSYAKIKGWGVTENLVDDCLGMYFTRAKELTKFRELSVKKGREIPKEYLVNCKESRLKLLAGLLDSDGYLGSNCFEITTKYEALCEGIKTLARSLGLAAYSSQKRGTIKATEFCGEYLRVMISGETKLIPTKLARKQAGKRVQSKDVLRTGFSLEYLGKGDYYGFIIDGDRRFLLWDFTVTHNTVTLQKMVEIFSNAGTAVFLPDVKGDLTALADPGCLPPNVVEMLKERGIDEPDYKGLPVEYWTATENHHGQRISTRLTSFGVDLLSSVMNLNSNQASVLISVFKLADDENIDLFTLDDLLEFIRYIFDDVKGLSKIYGSISTMSLSVIIRAIIRLQDLGFDAFFSEDEIYTTDFIRQCKEGRGVVNILQSVELVKTPELYGTVIMYLLKKLYDVLPEVGNLPTPKIAFFFDESHLIFNLQSKTINATLENTVRLIRSKGVGVYFISQTPSDIPDAILGQLGNKIQHVLRASTPRDQRAVNAAADSMPQNPKIVMREELKQLAVGEAIISLLNADGASTMSERAYVLPPASKSGTIDNQRIIDNTEKSMLYLFYAGKDEVQYSKDQAVTVGLSNEINACFSFNDVLRLYKQDKKGGLKAFFKWVW